MAIKDIINEIEEDIQDVIQTSFDYTNTRYVPTPNDGALTYERGKNKTGKIISTCVLYADIRDSVELTRKHTTQTMGRIYTAFTKAVLKVARHHNGHTRNIIGDRVMIVFPNENCFTNAVNCAISINHICDYLINKKFVGVNFKCGIGIDYGDLKTIKVGIQRRGDEHGENKGLIWVGYPANIASRLTDMANKNIQETTFNVTFHPKNPTKLLNMLFATKPLTTIGGYPFKFDPYAPEYLDTVKSKILSHEQFIEEISSFNDGSMFFNDGKIIGFTKDIKKIAFPPILMTERVFNGYRNANPTNNSIVNNYWKKQNQKIKNVTNDFYGGNVTWVIN